MSKSVDYVEEDDFFASCEMVEKEGQKRKVWQEHRDLQGATLGFCVEGLWSKDLSRPQNLRKIRCRKDWQVDRDHGWQNSWNKKQCFFSL